MDRAWITAISISTPDIGVASLENVTTYIWRLVKERLPHLEEVELKRGMSGSQEGCIYRGETLAGNSLAA
jgi:6-pyruvoyltetrahydropterin/6-carboxytetrahydropterin synthase